MRPFAITVLGWLYIVVGIVGLVHHGLVAIRSWHPEDLWILLSQVLALIAGVFMLRGANWARWLACIWIAAHVVIAWLNGPGQALFHAIIFVGITILLFRADARAFFRSEPAASPGA
jgi:uncharacterized membrane protein HdeD (DUF308 family)